MAFASGPVSFQRFFVSGLLPTEIDDQFISALASRAFGTVPTQSDDSQIGWIGPNHLFETDLLAERIACGSFAHLALRVDRLAVPPAVLKSYVRVAEESALEQSGREFLSRGERKKARQAAALRAEQETRSGGFRRMNAYPVLIDLANQAVYLGSTGVTMADKLMQLFADTFEASLTPADPECLAGRALSTTRKSRTLETLAPFHLVDPPDDVDTSSTGTFDSDLNFLGRELLTWLWFLTEQNAGALRVPQGDEVTVMLDRTLALRCSYGLTGSDVITADAPTRLPEARAALKTGKQPNRAGLVLGSPAGEFRFTLDGQRFTVSSLALPETGESEDPLARLEERFELIADAAALLDALFELYLNERTSPQWDDRLLDMRTWADRRTQRSTRASA